MEFSMRDWMIVIGILLILVVLLDGYRRIRNDRRNKIRVALNKQFLNSNSDLIFSELPNGGARVLSRNNVTEPDGSNSDRAGNECLESIADPSIPPAEHTLADPPLAEQAQVLAVDEPLFAQTIDHSAPHQVPDIKSTQNASSFSKKKQSKCAKLAAQCTPKQIDTQKTVFVINVLARENSLFKGPDLLHVLLACGLRFGDMAIFHRYETRENTVRQFSVANIIEPGTFDLDNISHFNTPGVSLFMSLPGPVDILQAFDTMVETAQVIAQHMKGDVLDDIRNPMTPQTLEHYRQQLRDYKKQITDIATCKSLFG